MSSEYIEIDLENEEKQAILKYASFFVFDATTNNDLKNKRKKWVRFKSFDLTEVIGELSYHFNRCRSDKVFYLLDQLIDHLENYEKRA